MGGLSVIQQQVHIDKYDWDLFCYFDTKSRDAATVLERLDRIGIPNQEYYKATELLYSGSRNSGLTYTHPDKRTSIVVITHTTSPEQTLNTFSHELRHLADDIAWANDIPARGEQVAYLTGDIAMTLAANLLHLACDCPICSHHQ